MIGPRRRRRLLGTLVASALAGCAAPLPPPEPGDTAASARALLDASAAAHGQAALAGITDISVSYAGQWRGFVGRLQPALVDAGHRGRSEERLLLGDGLVAQAHTGPAGQKQVVRRSAAGSPGDVHVWFDGLESVDPDQRHAAALVADGYSLFLLGPMLLTGAWTADRAPTVERAGRERISLDGRPHECDVLLVRLAPGLGLSDADRLALFIDVETQLMRRVRFTLEGLDGTRGAVAEVDTFNHLPFRGVQWPTRFHEQSAAPRAAAGARLAADRARPRPRARSRDDRRPRLHRPGGGAGGAMGRRTSGRSAVVIARVWRSPRYSETPGRLTVQCSVRADWRLTGLDLNRGFDPATLDGPLHRLGGRTGDALNDLKAALAFAHVGDNITPVGQGGGGCSRTTMPSPSPISWALPFYAAPGRRRRLLPGLRR